MGALKLQQFYKIPTTSIYQRSPSLRVFDCLYMLFHISRKCRSLLKRHILLFLEMSIYASVSMAINARPKIQIKFDKPLVANLACWSESHLIKSCRYFILSYFVSLWLLRHQWRSRKHFFSINGDQEVVGNAAT